MSPKLPRISPAATRGSHRCFCSSVPCRTIMPPARPEVTDSVTATLESTRPSSSITRAHVTASAPSTAVLRGERHGEQSDLGHRAHDLEREGLVLVALGGAGRDDLFGELPHERAHLLLFVGEVEVHAGANPSRSPIDPVRSSDSTARTRAPMSASAQQAMEQDRVGAVELHQRVGRPADRAPGRRCRSRATVQDTTTPSGPHSVSGVEAREATFAEDPGGQVRHRAVGAPRAEEDAAIAERLEERGVADPGRVPEGHGHPPSIRRMLTASPGAEVRDVEDRAVASATRSPHGLDRHPDADRRRIDVAELVQEPAVARAVQPDHGRQLGHLERAHVPRDVADRERLDGAGRRDLGPSVGRPEAPLAERARRHERPPARGADRREDPALAQRVQERAHHLAGVPRVADVEVRLDGARRRRGTRRRTAASARASSRAGSRSPRRRGSRPGVFRPHHDHGADLHQIAPRLGHAALGRPGDLALAGLAAQLPEELGDLHQAGGRDRVADPEQPAARAAREVAVARRHAGRGRLGRLPLVEQQQALEVVQLLVVERVVGLGHVDLLARLRHAGHRVGHARRVLDVLGIDEVAVRPVRRVEVPPDALDPDRSIGEAPRRVLRRQDERDGAVADRRDVEALHGPREDLGGQDVLDRDVGLTEQRRGMPCGVALVLHGHARDVPLVQAVAVHVTLHLQREDPQQVRPERAFDDVVEDREERRPADAAGRRTSSPRRRRARRRPGPRQPCTTPGSP